MKKNVAVVGATGMVGRNMISILIERDFPIDNIFFFSSKKSSGTFLKFKDKDILVEELTEENVKNKKIDIALFSAGGDTSLNFAPVFAKYGATVIDNSSAWRMDENVPLVVPEVNKEDIKLNKGIIANPNCSTIQAMLVLKPLLDKYEIERIIYSTYQSVSGAGMSGYNDLINGENGEKPKKFPHPIHQNLIPQIDVFLENGYTKEEVKMINETRKILHNKDLKITATCVRVPVLYSHSESINVELKSSFVLEDIFNLFEHSEGVCLMDDISKGIYPTPKISEGKDDVFIGRIRRDHSIENGLNLWIVSDNTRKGAALNAVQIAELL